MRRNHDYGCDGECCEHTGRVRKVHVWHGGYDWGYFDYCDAAIELDKSRGFTIVEDEETPELNNSTLP